MAGSGWISVEENRAARRALLRQVAAIKKSRPAPLVVLQGLAGSGKSRLVEEGLARLMAVVPGASYRILEPAEVERSLKSPYSDWYEGRELAEVDWLILENFSPLPENREIRLANLLDQRKKQGRAVLITTRGPWQPLTTTPRLASRLRGGLCVSLEPWGPMSRRRWLNRLMVQGQLSLTPALARWLAAQMPPLPGEMEAACQRWVEKQRRKGAPLTSAELRELVLGAAKKVNHDEILEKVAKTFGATLKQLRGKSREKKLALARCAAVWLLRKIGGLSLAAIGALLGGRDHSTIRNSYARAQLLKRRDPPFSTALKSLQDLI